MMNFTTKISRYQNLCRHVGKSTHIPCIKRCSQCEKDIQHNLAVFHRGVLLLFNKPPVFPLHWKSIHSRIALKYGQTIIQRHQIKSHKTELYFSPGCRSWKVTISMRAINATNLAKLFVLRSTMQCVLDRQNRLIKAIVYILVQDQLYITMAVSMGRIWRWRLSISNRSQVHIGWQQSRWNHNWIAPRDAIVQRPLRCRSLPSVI